MWKGRQNVQERLDKAFGNQYWLDTFPTTRVTHLTWSRSDHHPISVQDGSLAVCRGKPNLFRIQAAWFKHPQFEQFLTDTWRLAGNVDLVQKLDSLWNSLTTWNREVFGNIFDRKFRCLASLGGIQKALQRRSSAKLAGLESTLRRELDEILEQEDIFLRQKSRVTWLLEGERCTKFFHSSTLLHRRRNKVLRLKLVGDIWCEDQVVLQEKARVLC